MQCSIFFITTCYHPLEYSSELYVPEYLMMSHTKTYVYFAASPSMSNNTHHTILFICHFQLLSIEFIVLVRKLYFILSILITKYFKQFFKKNEKFFILRVYLKATYAPLTIKILKVLF